MAELDLIPEDYRSEMRLRRQVNLFAGVLFIMLFASITGYAALQYLISSQRNKIEGLQQEKSITMQQRAQLEQLRGQQQFLQGQLHILEGLRGGLRVRDLFITMDRAMIKDRVWFINWRFNRAGSLVERKPDTVNTGYFIVVPKGELQTREQAWKIDTHMEITGQALDYAALSDFVQRLLQQQEIADVKVIKTSLRNYTKMNVVDFDLAVVVNGHNK